MAEEFKSLKGHLLLDGGKLRGSFFHRTVVLICQHDAEGAMGLVLNRASGKNVGTQRAATASARSNSMRALAGRRCTAA